jgi:hypothetical protein
MLSSSFVLTHPRNSSKKIFNVCDLAVLSPTVKGPLFTLGIELHLLRYHQRRYQYHSALSSSCASTRPSDGSGNVQQTLQGFVTVGTNISPFPPFSPVFTDQEYDGRSISDDMIAEVYLSFSVYREQDSATVLRAITGVSIGLWPWASFSVQLITASAGKVLSFDATYRSAKKAKVATKSGPRQKVFDTLTSVIEENGLIVTWVCQACFISPSVPAYRALAASHFILINERGAGNP